VSINQSIVGRSRSSEQVATLGLLDRPQQGLANECGCICGPWSFQQLAKSITNKLLRMQIPRSERGLSRTLSPVLSNFRAEAVASHPHTQAVADSLSLQLFLRAKRCDGSVVSDSNKSAVYSNKKRDYSPVPEAVTNTDSSAIWHLPPVPLLYLTSHLACASCAVAVTNRNSPTTAAGAAIFHSRAATSSPKESELGPKPVLTCVPITIEPRRTTHFFFQSSCIRAHHGVHEPSVGAARLLVSVPVPFRARFRRFTITTHQFC
jgi:hypothetical protein